MVLKLPWSQKRILQIFATFWVMMLKGFPGKVRQNVQNYLNQNLVIWSFLENGFEVTLSSKANILSLWKEHFSVFWKFLSDYVETIFWKSEAKRWTLLKPKFSHRKFLRKWLWSYLELKDECCECLKRAFVFYFANFWVIKLKPFSGKVRQSVQNYLNRKLVIWSFVGSFLCSNTNVLSVWKEHCSVFANFWVTKLKPYFGKVRQSIQSYLNQSLVIGSFLENGFEAVLSSKTSVVSVWNEHFPVFRKGLSDEVENIFWES